MYLKPRVTGRLPTYPTHFVLPSTLRSPLPPYASHEIPMAHLSDTGADADRRATSTSGGSSPHLDRAPVPERVDLDVTETTTDDRSVGRQQDYASGSGTNPRPEEKPRKCDCNPLRRHRLKCISPGTTSPGVRNGWARAQAYFQMVDATRHWPVIAHVAPDDSDAAELSEGLSKLTVREASATTPTPSSSKPFSSHRTLGIKYSPSADRPARRPERLRVQTTYTQVYLGRSSGTITPRITLLNIAYRTHRHRISPLLVRAGLRRHEHNGTSRMAFPEFIQTSTRALRRVHQTWGLRALRPRLRHTPTPLERRPRRLAQE